MAARPKGPGMSRARKQRASEQEERLREAEGAADTVSAQGVKVNRQLRLVDRLLLGWRRVHETNHLAQLFRDEGRLG